MEVFLVFSQDSIFLWQIVDNPVTWQGVGGGLQGLHCGQSSTAFLEQIAEIPDPGGGLQDFQPVQSSAASSSVSPGHRWARGFSDFSPGQKKSGVRRPGG